MSFINEAIERKDPNYLGHGPSDLKRKIVKSIFVDPLRIDGLEKTRANHLIIALEGLTPQIWQELKKLINMKLTISLGAFEYDICPANPDSFAKLKEKLDQALEFKPSEIWLDHFRFDGNWERIEGTNIPNIHPECNFCQNKDRVQILSELAKKVMQHINNQTKVGYFAVPLKKEEIPQLVIGLGQDHFELGKIFDLISPMLYHKMIKKPTGYISEYVSWLQGQTQQPILPIIQIKDMPDDLEDQLTEQEIGQTFKEAIKPPSIGVSFFYWTHALETGKTKIITNLFTS